MAAINIYVESSFDSVISGSRDAAVNFRTRTDDNIGLNDIPAYIRFLTSITGQVDAPAEYITSGSGTGFFSTALSYELDTVSSGVLVALTEYATPTTSGQPDQVDVDLKYFTGFAKASGTHDPKIDAIMGEAYLVTDNILNSYWTYGAYLTNLNYYTAYTAGSDYDPGEEGDYVVISGTDDYQAKFTVGVLTSGGAVTEFVDITLAGYVFDFYPYDLSYKFDIYSGLENTTGQHYFDLETISGALNRIDFDLYSGTATSGSLNTDSYCCLIDLTSYSMESQTIPGTISYCFADLYTGTSGTKSFNFDVRLLSLKISNFSLAVGEYANANGTICVDITDDIHNVATSGTYFIIDGTVTSGTFTPITDGYRMCYDPIDDFASILGATTFTVHAENDNGDVLERDFYLTSGYIVEYDNQDQDYRYESQVVVRMSAENFASCPAVGTFAYWFTTTPKLYYRSDLGATIIPRPFFDHDLSAEVTPQTGTIYYYGKVFRVEVRARDFAGNVMEPYIFEFRIEDKPED